MNTKIFVVLLTGLSLTANVFAQRSGSESAFRPRVVGSSETAKADPTPTPTPRSVVVISSATPFPRSTTKPTPKPSPRRVITSNARPQPRVGTLRYSEIKSKIEEAKRAMRTRPLKISSYDPVQTTSIVRLAFYDRNTRNLDYVVISKKDFLTKDSNLLAKSESRKFVRIRTIRGNGVNTPVMIFDSYNRAHVPLLVQYPIEKFGRFREMSYYVSTHPGIVTAETSNAGRMYVRNILDIARQKLRAKGIFIQPKVTDIAERLALVEHVDHYRFRTEYHPRIYNDIYTLYALNQGQTYRYSVSRAGAGGMVQMIPATYRMIRSRYYRVGLMPDFVAGMRDHVNAAQAMLLYMQMTWNDMTANSTISKAMYNGIATQEQLMAAGYNSNPARIPKYIRRGGAGWTRLIPRETKVYLKIYKSVEQHVPLRPRSR
ncbi:MAG: hypothetical protein HKN25_17475 [Pyrinomonadaceae bacterium]|nr:hypothetical protein [Pyrinomonadaceae bacterium]